MLDRILRVRAEMARLLGYPNWAGYDMASRMAGDVKTVSDFIDRVVAAAGPKAARELDELSARSSRMLPAARCNLWDRQYYSELVRRSSYDFDSQTVRPYFAVRPRAPGRARRHGPDLRRSPTGRSPTSTVWHPSVRVYEMRDGRPAGRPRLSGPASAAEQDGQRRQRQHGSAGRGGQAAFPKSCWSPACLAASAGDPGLMTHDEVRTLFHEFGHVVHRLIGGHQPWQQPEQHRAGARLHRGAVADARGVGLGSGDAGDVRDALPDRRADSGARSCCRCGGPASSARASRCAAQMVLARVSLSYHDRDPKRVDSTALWKEIHNRYLPIPYVEGRTGRRRSRTSARPGYASAYYTYMWSLVIAKDLFSRFDGKDLSAPGVARRYRDTIFAPGSSKPAATLVRDFLGRPFNATRGRNG